MKIVISPKETKEYSWAEVSMTSSAIEVESIPSLPNEIYSVGDIIKIVDSGTSKYYKLVFTSSPTIESMNLVNLGYKTSENPLENLDKYLIREEGYIPKYSKTSLGVVDLTSGTYLSKGFREDKEENTVSGKKYSFRKVYRKGQSALVGLPDNLKEDIVDIQEVVLDSDEAIEDIGTVVYDYYRGEVYRYRRFRWVKLTNLDEEPNYKEVFSSDPESATSVDDYNEGDIIKYSDDFYILRESDDDSSPLKEEVFDDTYLFRYYGEYFLWKDKQTEYKIPMQGGGGTQSGEISLYSSGLVRGNFLGIRTWISTENENSKNLPWASRYWMSNDGELSIGDKVWVLITSGSSKQKLLGTVQRREKGTCLVLESKFPIDLSTQEVRLNGVKMRVTSRIDNSTRETKYISIFYQVRKLNRRSLEEVSDLTKDLIFKNKINYITIMNYTNYES